MRIVLLNKNRITKLILPEKVEGSFWVIDEDEKNVVNIESANGRWVMKENDDTKIVSNNSYIPSVEIQPNSFIVIERNGEQLIVYAEYTIDTTINYYAVNAGSSITFGKDNTNAISYDNAYLFNEYLTLNYMEDGWHVSIKDNSRVYINDYLLSTFEAKLAYGDQLFVLGSRIGVYKNIIAINNPDNKVKINNGMGVVQFQSYVSNNKTVIDSDQIKEIDLYKDDDYFFKTPRVRRFIETANFEIAPPPSREKGQEMPALLVLGPTVTMGIVSVISTFTTIKGVLVDGKNLMDSMTSLVTAGSTLLSTLLWPSLTSSYEKKRTKKRDKERLAKYKNYLAKKKEELKELYETQKSILCENLIPVRECEKIILTKSRNLWERRSDQKDFLTVRVGNGSVPLDMECSFKAEEFVLEEDKLKDSVNMMIKEYKNIDDVPVSYSFMNKNVTAIMGNTNDSLAFMDNVLLQLMSFHSYDDLKIVFLTSKKNSKAWSKYKELPHCFSNDRNVRYYADDMEEIKYVGSVVAEDYVNRANDDGSAIENESSGTRTYTPYYLIITDDYPLIRKVGIIDAIVSNKVNLGYSLVCLENRLSKLPSTCEDFIVLNDEASILSTHIDNYFTQKFNKEIDYGIDVRNCVSKLANVPIEFSFESRSLPKSVGFLEMYGVGKVEQLNTLNRWRLNDPIKSLRAQIGINDEGNPIYLDMHEKFHGPHGLIAGTTGSGKSEFIITYILSMIINYSPNEAAFILIDYKGGGLAGAFENKTLGLRLPHLAGTITNLDKASLNRTLVSINSELQRRQMKFNEVRDKLGESTIDIYKYQKFFREGKIDEPMPHLFIISDEFAELKSQQPEFMDDLVSAARIGRSLGVHLVLATQKPSGVVTDQIWSNTKFRVCLKVADAGDSNEMLKKPDAATITNAGRFYLQVGNDEIYVLGQSGWAGTPYVGSDTVKKKYDRSLTFIDDVGQVIASNDGEEKKKATGDNGDELGNIMKYVCALAERENVKAKNLWLPAIPDFITVDDLKNKYNPKLEGISAVIGEYDAPSKQYQDILTTRFDEDGNTAIIGNTASAREMLMAAMIYSLCTTYTAEDINIYVIDFGSESLRLYGNFPQVGDIVYLNDKDKFAKLLGVILEEMNYRKNLFADYNGEFKLYNKNSGSKLPVKIFMFNNYDAVKENYSDIEDMLGVVTRDSERYGISFVLSVSEAMSIYRKTRTNFHNFFMLDMKERTDYMDVFTTKLGNIYPAEYEGRGLFETDMIYEYQTASVHEADTLVDFVKQRAQEVKNVSKEVAPNIPSLPDVVTLNMFDKYLKDINKLPLGIYKDDLKPAYYNFFNQKATVISSKDVFYCIDLLKNIIYDTRKLNQMIVLIDAEQELAEIGGMVNTYADKNFESFILQFEQFLDKEIEGKNIKVLCIISGLENFQGSMEDNKFNGFFNGCKVMENVNLILVDSSYKLKKIEYEDWYSGIVDNTNGIWVGEGFLEQNVFNCNSIQSGDDKFNCQYAWFIKNGDAKVAKINGEGRVKDEE